MTNYCQCDTAVIAALVLLNHKLTTLYSNCTLSVSDRLSSILGIQRAQFCYFLFLDQFWSVNRLLEVVFWDILGRFWFVTRLPGFVFWDILGRCWSVTRLPGFVFWDFFSQLPGEVLVQQ